MDGPQAEVLATAGLQPSSSRADWRTQLLVRQSPIPHRLSVDAAGLIWLIVELMTRVPFCPVPRCAISLLTRFFAFKPAAGHYTPSLAWSYSVSRLLVAGPVICTFAHSGLVGSSHSFSGVNHDFHGKRTGLFGLSLSVVLASTWSAPASSSCLGPPCCCVPRADHHGRRDLGSPCQDAFQIRDARQGQSGPPAG